MATITAVQRSGPAIRAALAEHGASGQLERFEDEMRAALTRAADELDLVGVDAVLMSAERVVHLHRRRLTPGGGRPRRR